jgi:hypothetical protein
LKRGFWAFARARGIDPLEFADTHGLEMAQWIAFPKNKKRLVDRDPQLRQSDKEHRGPIMINLNCTFFSI